MTEPTVRVVRTRQELDTLAASWNGLVEESLNNNIFLTWEWISTWVDVYVPRGDLFVIAVSAGDELQAIAPFWIERVRAAGLVPGRVLRFLGSGEACSDYLDVIVRKHNHEEWLRCLWQQLFGPLAGDWDILEYSDAPSDSRSFTLFYRWADEEDGCLTREIVRTTVCPFLPLPDSAEALSASFSSTRRYGLNRSRKRLNEQGEVEFRFLESGAELDAEFQRLRELNLRSWQERGQPGSFATSTMVKFHSAVSRRLLESGRLLLCSLWSAGTYLGSFYGYVYGGVLYYYVMSVEKSDLQRVNTGDLLLAACMEEGIRRGCREFDFLRGDEPYKYRWTDRMRTNLTARIYNRGVKASLFFATEQSFRALKYGAKGILGLGGRRRPTPEPERAEE